jgi:hypothetical protein
VVDGELGAVAGTLVQEPADLGVVLFGVVGYRLVVDEQRQHLLGEGGAGGAAGVRPPVAAFGVDAGQVGAAVQVEPGHGEDLGGRPGGGGAPAGATRGVDADLDGSFEVVGDRPERGVFLDAEEATPGQQVGQVGRFDATSGQGLAVRGEPGVVGGGVGGQHLVGGRSAAGVGVPGPAQAVEQHTEGLRGGSVLGQWPAVLVRQVVPQELLQSAQADGRQTAAPGQGGEPVRGPLGGGRVVGGECGQRRVDDRVAGVEPSRGHRASARPQHCLYLRPEPHQQGWLRVGGHAVDSCRRARSAL